MDKEIAEAVRRVLVFFFPFVRPLAALVLRAHLHNTWIIKHCLAGGGHPQCYTYRYVPFCCLVFIWSDGSPSKLGRGTRRPSEEGLFLS